MPGQTITVQQERLYMILRSKGNKQTTAAAKAGFSVRTGHSVEHGKHQPTRGKQRDYRTRKDPFEAVWASELKPMLEAQPKLQALTLLDYLQDRYPGQYPDNKLRTMQRRVEQWRVLEGPDKEVMFRQRHEPGQQGLSDFTTLKGVTVEINGKPFSHLLYHFRLAYSGWSYMKVIQGGESYTALATGLQEALFKLGGAPQTHRTDSLSAAYKNLDQQTQSDTTQAYRDLCDYFAMQPDRNNPGRGHENGSIESPHGHIKRRIQQALLLRGHYQFDTIEAYQAFITEIVDRSNRRHQSQIAEEKTYLKDLPQAPTATYTSVVAVVTSSSTIKIKNVVYTVPSRLQGCTLQIRLYDDRLEAFLNQHWVITLKRIYSPSKQRCAYSANYRHVIHSLAQKPQAFRQSVMQQELLPTQIYRTIWEYIDQHFDPQPACRLIVGLLHLAATTDCETALGDAVLTFIQQQKPINLTDLQLQFNPDQQVLPEEQRVNQHLLSDYDQLITANQEAAHV